MVLQTRHVRNYLLNRQFQLRYTLMMVVISALLASGLGYIWYDEMRTASRLVEVKTLASLSESEVALVQKDLASQDLKRLFVLAGFGVIFIFVLTGFGIVITHKVAGPLYKISAHMEDIVQGRLYELWDVRKGDHLQDFWTTFKSMQTKLRDNTRQEAEILGEVITKIEEYLGTKEREGNIEKELDKLKEMHVHKRASLRARSKTLELRTIESDPAKTNG